MKRNKSIIIIALLITALVIISASCVNENNRSSRKQHQVEVINDDGFKYKIWTTKGSVGLNEGVFIFIDVETGKRVYVTGNVIVTEL